MDILLNTPSHLYDSALELCPSTSWLFRNYTPKFSQKIKVLGPAEWRASTRTVFCYSRTIACKNNTVAYGWKNITILDSITSSKIAVLPGHTEEIFSLTFSLDGSLLVSGSEDKTIKLWDIQTGGIIKTFHGHTKRVFSVSISADNTMIVSGSMDKTIRLWNIGTGECQTIEGHKHWVTAVSFFPRNSRLLLSVSVDQTVRQWDIDGHCNVPPITGSRIAFSSDGTQFISCHGGTATIQNADCGDVLAVFSPSTGCPRCCCFSPDGKFVAFGVDKKIHLWDVTGSNPCFVKTFVEHTKDVNSLVFSSPYTLISASSDETIKFLQVSDPSAAPITYNTNPIPSASFPIKAVSLQTKGCLAFSIDSEGVVMIWDISTGHFKQSLRTPARNILFGDIQLVNDRLTVVWCMETISEEICAWGTNDQVQIMATPQCYTKGLRILGDGSRVFHMYWTIKGQYIQVWSLHTGESIYKMKTGNGHMLDPLHMDNSKIFIRIADSISCGWDFGALGSIPIYLSKESIDTFHVDFIGIFDLPIPTMKIVDSVTRQEVFPLPDRYAYPVAIQWNGRYLIAGYGSGEVLILDLSHIHL